MKRTGKPLSEKKKASNKRWNDAHHSELYERGTILFRKGEKDVFQEHAEKHDRSFSAFAIRAMANQMKLDKEQEQQKEEE